MPDFQIAAHELWKVQLVLDSACSNNQGRPAIKAVPVLCDTIEESLESDPKTCLDRVLFTASEYPSDQSVFKLKAKNGGKDEG